VAIFVGGTFVGFGGYLFGDRTGSDVAQVSGKRIPRRKFDFLYNRQVDELRQQDKELTSDVLKQVESEVIQELIQDEVFWQEAARFGIKVTDAELAANIRSIPAFQREGIYDPRLHYNFVRQVFRITPKEFDEYQRRRIAFAKLRYFISTSIYVPESEIRSDYVKKFPGKTKSWEKEKNDYINSYRQEVVNAVFNEYLKQLNNTVSIKVFWKG
jgi:peptidyl-prolyl cis-trans isomerase D